MVLEIKNLFVFQEEDVGNGNPICFLKKEEKGVI